MSRSARNTRILTLAASTALASAMLTGCASNPAPLAEVSASRADVALKKGKVSEAIAHAEAAVLADPQNAQYRTALGAAYLEAGRFLSARASFDDALTLGDESPRTALGFALASAATGDNQSAIEVLEDWQDDIPAGDLGLAFALAGDPARGVQILSNAVRAGDVSPKTRQNLAYALALNGNWAGARIMAAQDVPADQLDARISQWAATARPEEATNRVATLLGTRAVADSGQPAQLALANNPSHEQLSAEAAALAEPAAEAPTDFAYTESASELPAVETAAYAPVAPAPSSEPDTDFQAAFVEPAPAPAATPAAMIASAASYIARPVVQATPAAPRAPDNKPQRIIATGDHLVQLGSFSTEAGAKRAWSIYERRYPEIAQLDMVITKAVVRGKTYYRVSAGGFARADAGSFCSNARRSGQGCFAWTDGKPMKGAVDTGVRMARR